MRTNNQYNIFLENKKMELLHLKKQMLQWELYLVKFILMIQLTDMIY